MKNIIITVCLTVIFATPCVAATKVFGEIDASYDNVFVVGTDYKNELKLNSLLFGVKGATEIKKDISFIYQFSWGVGSEGIDDIANSGLNNRKQVIGIASPKGAFILGRFDTPFKVVGKKSDLFFHSQLGQNRNITNASTWDVLADKIVVFQSPKRKGIQLSAAYASDISDTSRLTPNGSAFSFNGFYQKNKFLFGAGYEHHDLDNSSASTDALRLSVAYKNGALKMVSFFQRELNEYDQTGDPDATVLGLGVEYKKSKGAYKAQLYSRDADFTSTSHLFALGYDHKYSKELDIYAQAAIVTNQDFLNGYDIEDAISGDDSEGLSIGVRYKF